MERLKRLEQAAIVNEPAGFNLVTFRVDWMANR
jgi:hypothetical protein